MKSGNLIDFGELIKKAWDIIWRFKYLWLLGFLVGGGANIPTNGLSYIMNGSSNNKDWQSFVSSNTLSHLPEVGKVLGASDTAISSAVAIAAALFVFIISLLFLYIHITARGAIIQSVNHIDSGENISVRHSWHLGQKYFWRIFAFSLLGFLAFFLPFILLAAPVVIMFVIHWYLPAVILGIIFMLILIVYLIYMSLAILYGERILVLENEGSWASIWLGVKFFNKNWKNILLTYLILMAIMMGAGTILAISLLIIGGLLFAIGYGVYSINVTAAIIVAIPFGLAFFAALFVASGIIGSYQSSLITLSYKRMKALN